MDSNSLTALRWSQSRFLSGNTYEMLLQRAELGQRQEYRFQLNMNREILALKTSNMMEVLANRGNHFAEYKCIRSVCCTIP